MSDREQAIKDVAAALGCDDLILSQFICNNGEYKVYAVQQRERVLQLEREKSASSERVIQLERALREALKFVEAERDCRENSFLPEPDSEEEGYLTEAFEVVDLIRAALEVK